MDSEGQYRIVLGVIFSVLLIGLFARGADSAGGVVINELMWDGVEYIELFNGEVEDVALDGWKLTRQQADKEEKDIVIFEVGDVLSAGGYFLLERNEEATTVMADKVTSGVVLVNGGELVRLYDKDGGTVDSANRLAAWFAGENTDSGVAMERVDVTSSGEVVSSWQSSTGIIGGRVGTPGAANSEKDDGSPVSYSDDVVISEFLPNPSGSDAEGEWIELWNMGSDEVNLSEWVLDDEDGGSSPFTIPKDTVISGGGYLVFNRSQTKIALNNNGDHVRLLSPDEIVKSEAIYTGSVKDNQSYNLVESEYVLSTTPTPGAKNVITSPSSESQDEDESEGDAADYQFSTTIIINEFLVDPVGSDLEGEFIELINKAH